MLTNEQLAKRNKERDMQFNEQVIAPGEIVNSLPGAPKIETPKIEDQITQNDKQIFGDFKPIEPINPPTIDLPKIPKIETTGKVETGMQTGTDIIGGQTGFDTGSDILDKELTTIQTDKNKAIEDTKKSFLLGKSEFEKNKQYFTNYDEVNNLYTGVLDELVKSMDDYGVVSDARYSQIASKYGLTVDEVKNPNSILNRANLSEEGKEKTGFNKLQSGIDDLETAKARKLADIERSLAQAQQNYDWQIEDVAKQLARNVGWTEAQGAWSGALRGSGYLQGIQNIKDDGKKTIDRLNILKERVASASEEDLSRVTQDYNKALTEAKKGLDTQLEDLKKNSILALSEAQATYGMGSDKLMKTLEKINEEYGMKSNQAVSAYLTNLKSMNDLANQNISLVEKANELETSKLDKKYNQYLENNGVVLQNTSLNTIATDLQNGLISVNRAKDLQNIMTSSIQSTLGALAPLTTQDLSTITSLLNQGLTPAEVIATMRQDERFQPKAEAVKVDKTIDLGDKTRIYYSDGSFEEVKKTDKPTQDWSKLNDTTLYNQKTGETTAITQTQSNTMDKTEGEVGGQCGVYARQYTGIQGSINNLVGPTITERKKNFKDKEPVVGGLALFTGANYDKTYGHIGVITGINSDGTLTITESNLKGDEKITTRVVNPAEVTGFYNNTPLAKGQGGETTQEDKISTDAKNWVDLWNKGAMDLETILTKIGSSKEALPLKNEVTKYISEQGGVAWRQPNDPAVKSMENLKTNIDDLLKDTDQLENVSGGYQFSPWDSLTKKKQDYLGKIQNLLDNKTLEDFIGLKAQGATFGALSNEELKMLQASSSVLASRAIRDESGNITGFNMSEKAFKTELEKLKTLYDDKINRMTGKGIETPTGNTSTNTYNANNGKVYEIKINPNK